MEGLERELSDFERGLTGVVGDEDPVEAVGTAIFGTRRASLEVLPTGCAKDATAGPHATDARRRSGSPLWGCTNFGATSAGILLASHES